MRRTKNFSFREGDLVFVVRTEAMDENFMVPFTNEVEFQDFEDALNDYLRRVREYDWETHQLVIRSKKSSKENGTSFEVVITNRKRDKVYAGVYVNVEALESEAMEKLNRIREILR